MNRNTKKQLSGTSLIIGDNLYFKQPNMRIFCPLEKLVIVRVRILNFTKLVRIKLNIQMLKAQ